MTEASPLVSCVMPTRDRRAFVGQAIWYFLRQDYPQRELVVVDDGVDAIADLLPADPRIRYIRLAPGSTLGAKRNAGCAASQGTLVAHWDDDDWQAPGRLRAQVHALLESGTDVCGAGSLLHYRLQSGDAWLYRGPATAQPWLAACTLLYRRDAWAAQPFAEEPEAARRPPVFLQRLPAAQLRVIADSTLCVALIHWWNAAGKHLSGPQWERRPLDEVSRLLAPDRDFYVGLRRGRLCPPAGAPPGGTAITLAAQFDVSSGYGSMAEYLALGLARAGATVRVLPLSLNLAGLTPEFGSLVERARRLAADPTAPALYFSWPRGDLERLRGAADLFVNTMWESSRLPASWPAQLNTTRTVIVPTRFVARVCRESGVTAPLEVIPEGVDPEVYHFEPRPAGRGLTTLVVGPLDDRKHVPEAIAAWQQAFAGDPDARLIVKTQYNYQNYVPDDPRIRYVDVVEPTRGIAHWYRRADVLLALGNEGFGLPLVEAMATGLPVIALNSEGQADVCAEAGDRLLTVDPVAWQPYDNALFGRCGVRGVPGVDDVAARLRWVATHRDEASAMGRAAAEWVKRERNVWAKGPAVLDVMERRGRPARSLRRTYRLWTASWGERCGIAEYTAYLAAAMPPATGIEVVARRPDLRSARLLHVQHQYGLYDEALLAQQCQQARRSRLPVVVTEHLVRPDAPPCEREADALVSLTERGAGLLRARCPGKRVEHIPHGCPTWFPPRKRRRGRVIGAFGFLQPHKGFWQLLDLLRRAPAADGTELLLFGYARTAADEARWEAAAAGLPVRRVADFLPVEEIATRLAAEADVLVFWYDEVGYPSASGAVRVGLASGVPVLTSPTSWFADVRPATYQSDDLAGGVRRLLEDTPLRERLSAAARAYCHEHSWSRSAQRHLALWRALEGA
jgi:glycosyltransferase involved in cell wall biosynthesis